MVHIINFVGCRGGVNTATQSGSSQDQRTSTVASQSPSESTQTTAPDGEISLMTLSHISSVYTVF